MGYACLVLSKFPFIKHFKLRIVQPRCQYTGPREWEISAEDLHALARDRAEAGNERAAPHAHSLTRRA